MCKICRKSMESAAVAIGLDHYEEYFKIILPQHWHCVLGMYRVLSHPFLKGRWPLSTESLAKEIKVKKTTLRDCLEVLKKHRIIDWFDEPHQGFHFTYGNHYVRFNRPKNIKLEIPDVL